jgi:prepilin-type N-terminal cleavage/methylation domain-containing protein
MIGAARIPKIPPTPFDKGGEVLTAFPPLKKGVKGGFAPGFTLVEVIVTIIAAGILGAILINFMGTAMSRSTRAVEYVQDEATAESIIEQIVADYVSEINKADPTLALEAIYTKNYGTKVKKDYITFNAGGGEVMLIPPNKSRTLKVQVEVHKDSGGHLITLLTESRQSGPPASPPVAF